MVAAVGVLTACDAGQSVAGRETGNHRLNLSLAGSVIAAPGAVFAAQVTYSGPSENRVTLASESVTLSTGGTPTTMSLTADVSGCLRDAEARGSESCTLDLATQLTRDGAVLDESVQSLLVNVTTERINAAPVQLFEVNTITISPTAITGLEPGDSQTLTAAATDRQGHAVTGRTLTWERVSGGITIGNDGELQAQTAGPARVRATMGGRSTELAFEVRPTSVATVQILPADTTVIAGASFAYGVTVRSSANAILTGRTINYTSSDPLVATVSASGVVTALAAGHVIITASSPDGRNGAVVSASASLTVLTNASIKFAPLALSFDTEIGQPLPVAQTVTVSNGGGGTLGTITVDAVESGITATLSTSTAPSTLTVRPSVTIAPGMVVTRTVRIKSNQSGVADGILSVTVVGKQPPPVIVSVPTVDFNNIPVGGMIATNVAVTTSMGRVLTGLTTTVQYAPNVTPWLTASLLGTSTATTLSLTANAGTLPIGTYIADVTVSSQTVPHIPATVRVTLQVVGVPRVVLNPKTVSIGPLSSAVSPGPVTNVNVTSGLATPVTGLSVLVQYIGQATGWLGTQLLSSTTPTTLRITPIPTGLPVGTYQARVIVSSSGPGVGPDTVNVTMIVAAPVIWSQVAVGDFHTCGLTTSGTVFCWGANSSGQLGNGTTTPSNVPVKVSGSQTFASVTTFGSHSCALTMSSALYCWGKNDEGQVGNGTLTNVLAPTLIGGMPFSSVATGFRHTCAIRSQQVFCWGNNSRGQIGDGTVVRRTVPTLLANIGDAQAVFLGYDYSCYHDTDSGSNCWGRNDLGEFGFGIGSDEVYPTYTGLSAEYFYAGWYHACSTSSGSAYCWGYNGLGQNGRGQVDADPLPASVAGSDSWSSLSGGYGHTCGITFAYEAYCWGDNTYGQIGAGTIGGIALGPVAVLTGMSFVEIRAGGGHTCARTSSGALYCFGENAEGQLGNGANINSGTLVPVAQAFPNIQTANAAACANGPTVCAANTRTSASPRARKMPPVPPASALTARPPVAKKR